MLLRILKYLDNIEEFNGVAISAKLRCTCGDCFFTFSHTGKQTRGILAPYIIRKNKQLILQAKCRSCNNFGINITYLFRAIIHHPIRFQNLKLYVYWQQYVRIHRERQL